MDYKSIKLAAPVEDVARWLQLKLTPAGETFRADCPVCEKHRVFVITPSKAAWYCHNCKKGGDSIYLCAHIKQIRQSEAAQLLQDAFMQKPEKPKRQSKRRQKIEPQPQKVPLTAEEIKQLEALMARL